MGLYYKMGIQYSVKYDNAEHRVINLRNRTNNLKDEIASVSFLSFNSVNKLKKIGHLKTEMSELDKEVKAINEDMFKMEKEGFTAMDDFDFKLFESLDKRGIQINIVISVMTNQLTDIKNELTNNSLLAAFFDGIGTLITGLNGIRIKLWNLTKKGVNVLLPPKAKKSLGYVIRKTLRGS
ncbi:MAG: hypothetical protein AB4062_00415 [Crocosphaera sp.]